MSYLPVPMLPAQASKKFCPYLSGVKKTQCGGQRCVKWTMLLDGNGFGYCSVDSTALNRLYKIESALDNLTNSSD